MRSSLPFAAEPSDLFLASTECASDLGFAILSATTAPPRKHNIPTYHPGTGDWEVVNNLNLENPVHINNVQPMSRVYVPGLQMFIWQLGTPGIAQLSYDFKTRLLRLGKGARFSV